jgi:hypothetical protein
VPRTCPPQRTPHAPASSPTAGVLQRSTISPVTIAVLAPVPLQHLESGRAVCEREGRVAFGSQMWELFEEIDNEGGAAVPVYIYASHAVTPAVKPCVTWVASYLRYIRSAGGEHPKGRSLRPPSTTDDAERFWAGFYEVSDLRPLSEDAHVQIANLRDRDGRIYGRSFVPERPMIISAQGPKDPCDPGRRGATPSLKAHQQPLDGGSP